MPFDLNILESNKNSITVACSHNGYESLDGSPVHRRKWVLKEDSLLIEDNILGKIYYPALAFFHLHPKLMIERNSPNSGVAKIGHKVIFDWLVDYGDAQLESGTFHSGFGKSESNKYMSVKLKNGKSRLILRWNSKRRKFN